MWNINDELGVNPSQKTGRVLKSFTHTGKHVTDTQCTLNKKYIALNT